MIVYPAQEVNRGLVTLGDGEFSLLLWLVGSSRCGNIARDGNTSPPETIRNAADLEINIIHFTKLLRCLLVVAPRLGVELHPVVAALPLMIISGL